MNKKMMIIIKKHSHNNNYFKKQSLLVSLNDVFPKQEALFTPKGQFLAKWSDSLNDIVREN